MMRLGEAARVLQARLVGADALFDSVSTDSRKFECGALFVALRGERFDGHTFVDAVARAGAAGAMVDAAAEPTGVANGVQMPLLVVEDTRLALGQLAATWRARFRIPLIAVAGSNGKTTVKEMIAAILREHYGEPRVLATEGNLNNDIGLPLTLLRLREQHLAAVIELGMNHPGETADLAALAQPTIALINNAQREHQEFMKSVAEVAQEHAALPARLPRGGVAVINADDAHAALWREIAERAGARVLDFGLTPAAAVNARHEPGPFCSRLELESPQGRASIELPLPGLHNVRNALAAIAASLEAGASLAAVTRGLQGFSAVRGRMQQRHGRGGAVVIDDTYNANPESVHAAIDVLSACPEPRVMALGDMGEVGEQGPVFHAEVGEHARKAGLTQLIVLGDLTRHSLASFGGGRHASCIEELIEELVRYDRPGATLLVKGSRFMRMERAVDALIAGRPQSGSAH